MGTINPALRFRLNLFRGYRTVQTALHELRYLFWECTLRCNLSCLHCGSDCNSDSQTRDMPLSDFLKVVDELKGHVDPHKTMIALTGGEPLLRNDLEECGRAFYRRGFPWGMVSNGYALSAKRLQSLLDAGLRSVTISLDGLSAPHDWLRGRVGSFGRALAAVKACVAAPDIAFDVVTCVNQRNILELKAVRDMLIAAGVKKWRLFTIFPKGRAAENAMLTLSDSQFRDMLDFILKTKNEGSIDSNYGCEGFLGKYEGKVRDGFFFCRAGINVGSVLADGSISACPSLRGDYIQGNIYRDSFVDCWQHRFTVMRDRRWARTGPCARCSEFKWCNGNGLHLRDQATGKLLKCHHRLIAG